MRIVIGVIALVVTTSLFAQKNVFQKKGIALKGYDVVAYFDSKPEMGKKETSTEYNGVRYYFTSEANKQKFEKNPTAYLPAYGGFCAYAMGAKGAKVSVNPETYEIRDGKLYMFYNKGKTNTLELWLQQNPGKLKDKADKNWGKISEK